jgi:hypothetical protein
VVELDSVKKDTIIVPESPEYQDVRLDLKSVQVGDFTKSIGIQAFESQDRCIYMLASYIAKPKIKLNLQTSTSSTRLIEPSSDDASRLSFK